MGEVNPELVRGMAEGLAPYVDRIIGVSDGLSNFDKIDQALHSQDATLPVAKGVFSVLNTDEKAAELFDAAAYQRAILHEAAFANSSDHSTSDENLRASATLRALVDVGERNAHLANVDNSHDRELSEYDSKRAAYEHAVKGLSTAGGSYRGW